MNQEAAILYVQQRMRELGKTPDQYHWQYKNVMPTPDEMSSGFFEISAYNELYILLKPEQYSGLFILADNSGFNSDDMSQSGVLEFTGMIRFIKIGAEWNFSGVILGGGGSLIFGKPISAEFIKVVIY
jgi:hypothetical protein